jgi:hypothetical protein
MFTKVFLFSPQYCKVRKESFFYSLSLNPANLRPLENGDFCSSSRKAKISTTGIYGIFRGLKFEPDAEIEQKVPFCKGLNFSGTN